MEKRPFIKEFTIKGKLFKIGMKVKAFIRNHSGDPGQWMTGTVVYFAPSVCKGHHKSSYEVCKKSYPENYFVKRKYIKNGVPCIDYYDYDWPFMMAKIDNPVGKQTWMKISTISSNVLFEYEQEYDPNAQVKTKSPRRREKSPF